MKRARQSDGAGYRASAAREWEEAPPPPPPRLESRQSCPVCGRNVPFRWHQGPRFRWAPVYLPHSNGRGMCKPARVSFKCEPRWFGAIVDGAKLCELRDESDARVFGALGGRGFVAGDELELVEVSEARETGRRVVVRVTHVTRYEPPFKPGWVALSIEVLT